MGGAIGDAIGGFYENRSSAHADFLSYPWRTSDDTQLTLATCQAIVEANGKVVPEKIARKFLEWYNQGKLTGLGASTLKALQDLQMGAHWALAGRTGERAAGNGAAMRIAPLAFKVDLTWERHLIRDVANITHKNDEAYTGALAVVIAIQQVLNKNWKGDNTLLDAVIDMLPDTRVRDSLIQAQQLEGISLQEAGKRIGSSGFVAESVPLAIYAAQQIHSLTVEQIFQTLIEIGGDTDTICSITGQILGSLLSTAGFPILWLERFYQMKESLVIREIIESWR